MNQANPVDYIKGISEEIKPDVEKDEVHCWGRALKKLNASENGVCLKVEGVFVECVEAATITDQEKNTNEVLQRFSIVLEEAANRDFQFALELLNVFKASKWGKENWSNLYGSSKRKDYSERYEASCWDKELRELIKGGDLVCLKIEDGCVKCVEAATIIDQEKNTNEVLQRFSIVLEEAANRDFQFALGLLNAFEKSKWGSENWTSLDGSSKRKDYSKRYEAYCWGRELRKLIKSNDDLVCLKIEDGCVKCVEAATITDKRENTNEVLQSFSILLEQVANRDPHSALDLLEAFKTSKWGKKNWTSLDGSNKYKIYINKVVLDLELIFKQVFSKIDEEEIKNYIQFQGKPEFQEKCPNFALFPLLMNEIVIDLINRFFISNPDSREIDSCERTFNEMELMLSRVIKIQIKCFKNSNFIAASTIDAFFIKYYIERLNNIWERINPKVMQKKQEVGTKLKVDKAGLEEMREKLVQTDLPLIACFINPFVSMGAAITSSKERYKHNERLLNTIFTRDLPKEIELLKLKCRLFEDRVDQYQDGISDFTSTFQIMKKDYVKNKNKYLREVDQEFEALPQFIEQVSVIKSHLQDILKAAQTPNPKVETSESKDGEQIPSSISHLDHLKDNILSNFSIKNALEILAEKLVYREFIKINKKEMEKNLNEEKQKLKDATKQELLKQEEKRRTQIEELTDQFAIDFEDWIKRSEECGNSALTQLLKQQLKEINQASTTQIDNINRTLKLGVLSEKDEERLKEIETKPVEAFVKQKLHEQISINLTKIVEEVLNQLVQEKNEEGDSFVKVLQEIKEGLKEIIKGKGIQEVIDREEKVIAKQFPTDCQFNLKYNLEAIRVIEHMTQLSSEQILMSVKEQSVSEDLIYSLSCLNKQLIKFFSSGRVLDNNPEQINQSISKLLESKILNENLSALIEIIKDKIKEQVDLSNQIEKTQKNIEEIKNQLLGVVLTAKRSFDGSKVELDLYVKKILSLKHSLEDETEWDNLMYKKSQRVVPNLFS